MHTPITYKSRQAFYADSTRSCRVLYAYARTHMLHMYPPALHYQYTLPLTKCLSLRERGTRGKHWYSTSPRRNKFGICMDCGKYNDYTAAYREGTVRSSLVPRPHGRRETWPGYEAKSEGMWLNMDLSCSQAKTVFLPQKLPTILHIALYTNPPN